MWQFDEYTTAEKGQVSPFLSHQQRPKTVSQDSIVGVATCYRLQGLEIKSWWGQDFPHPTRLALGPTQLPAWCVRGLFRKGKVAREWFWPSTPIYCQDKEKVRAIPLLPLWPFMACSRVNFTFTFRARRNHLTFKQTLTQQISCYFVWTNCSHFP
jgi:hypothetical protein